MKNRGVLVKILKLLLSRAVIFGICLIAQIIWGLVLILRLSSYSIQISTALNILSFFVVLWIVKRNENPAVKIAWIIPILTVPLLGGLLYLMFGAWRTPSHMTRKLSHYENRRWELLHQDKQTAEEIRKRDRNIAGQTSYISNIAGFPIYKNTKAEYFSFGEDAYPVMLEELKKAEHFIFLEYFIVENGSMWKGILEILEEKAAQGVDVRLIYDDVGSIGVLPFRYDKKLEARGIKCVAFNPFVPLLSIIMNNRDHRKIMVIDGHTGFSGGINIADEYINEKVRFGVWKDNAIMIKGEAVWNFTVMFLQMWNAQRKTDEDFEKFKPGKWHAGKFETDGYVQPYGDSPLDGEIVGENVYLNILNQARNYVYIFTPYLIIDNEMMTALILAAKRGVDVKIVVPGVPDKKIVYLLTQSYYEPLVRGGVRIYKYTPGFVHSKVFVCDDEIAAVGTINMDYRSLYLHFECGIYLYASETVKKVRDDVLETLEGSHKVTKKECSRGLVKGFFQAVLRVFAPLL